MLPPMFKPVMLVSRTRASSASCIESSLNGRPLFEMSDSDAIDRARHMHSSGQRDGRGARAGGRPDRSFEGHALLVRASCACLVRMPASRVLASEGSVLCGRCPS